MANTKISQLTALTNPTGNEEFVYALNNANGKVTLDTMKTYTQTGTQEELVSGTNIKTINGQSILGSGNMVISGGGGSGEDNDYDAVVDANGGGDYTTIADAITAGIKRIYIRNGTYTLSSQTLSTGDFKLVGESRNGVVIDVSYGTRSGTIFTLTSDTVSQANSFLFKNLTFNISYSGEYGYFIMFGGMGAGNGFLKMLDCNINVTQAVNGCNFYITGGSGNDTLIEGCRIEVYLSTGSFTGVGFQGISRRSTCINSIIVVDANASLAQSITFEGSPNGTYIGCRFFIGVDHKKSGDIATLGCGHGIKCIYSTSNYCNLKISGLQDDCSFPALGQNANYDTALNTAITNKSITIWKPSTSYTVGQYVQSGIGLTLAKCIEAHTSGTTYDSTKFEDVYGDVYINGILNNCDLTVWGTVIISGFAQYSQAVVVPSMLNNVRDNKIYFEPQSSGLSSIANLVVLGYRGFNDNQIYTDSTAGLKFYLGGECASFSGNRIISYTGNIYSGGYDNMITNNIWTYVTGETTPTATQVTSGNSVIDNNIFYAITDWND